MSVAAAVVGAATRMLDLYREAVKLRIPAGLQAAQTEDRFSLVELGKAASRIELAFKLLMFDVDEMYDQAALGQEFSNEQRARYRTDGAMLCDLALDAADALARSLGGSLLPNGPIERCFRDVHSMASHFLMQVTPAAELLGRTLVGLPLPPNARI
jgi:3-hydroxy-9,10-secoandrosta-1,3,5(10)-triene-9,17-dione monooxygenase